MSLSNAPQMDSFSDVNIYSLFKCLLILPLITAAASWIFFSNVEKRRKTSRSPPTLPYILPVVKSTYSFLFAGEKLLRRAL